MPKLASTPHPDCADFVVVVERLLSQRRAAIAPGYHERPNRSEQSDVAGTWGPRQWTQIEFEDMVYASYKPMRQGRITRPPRREKIMEIADYLACTLDERNDLLMAARATPIAPYLTGDALEAALTVAIGLAASLPLPAFVINRDGRIHHMNAHILTMNGATAELAAAIPPDHLNLLHLLFDPSLPLQPKLIRNQASWTRMARQTIAGFQRANTLSRYEPWYQDLLGKLMTLPEFESHWRAVEMNMVDASLGDVGDAMVLDVALPGQGQPAQLRPLLISIGYFQFDFPQVMAFAPANTLSRDLLRNLGIPAF